VAKGAYTIVTKNTKGIRIKDKLRLRTNKLMNNKIHMFVAIKSKNKERKQYKS